MIKLLHLVVFCFLFFGHSCLLSQEVGGFTFVDVPFADGVKEERWEKQVEIHGKKVVLLGNRRRLIERDGTVLTKSQNWRLRGFFRLSSYAKGEQKSSFVFQADVAGITMLESMTKFKASDDKEHHVFFVFYGDVPLLCLKLAGDDFSPASDDEFSEIAAQLADQSNLARP